MPVLVHLVHFCITEVKMTVFGIMSAVTAADIVSSQPVNVTCAGETATAGITVVTTGKCWRLSGS